MRNSHSALSIKGQLFRIMSFIYMKLITLTNEKGDIINERIQNLPPNHFPFIYHFFRTSRRMRYADNLHENWLHKTIYHVPSACNKMVVWSNLLAQQKLGKSSHLLLGNRSNFVPFQI